MSTLKQLTAAMELGVDNRRHALDDGGFSPHRFPPGDDCSDAWLAGYENDLEAWMKVAKRAQGKPRKHGRWMAHDDVVFNAHTSSPYPGEFLGYAGHQSAKVLLDELGRKVVPLISLTRPTKKRCPA